MVVEFCNRLNIIYNAGVIKLMNIAHYFLGFPPIHNGGLVFYVKDLVYEQRKKLDNIYLLFPGEANKVNFKSQIKLYDTINNIDVYKIINAHEVSICGINRPRDFIKKKKNNYKEFFKDKKIDILHIHSLLGLPQELIKEAKELGIKTIFTTHDYFGICPTINLFTWDKKICLDYKDGCECIKCNFNSNNKINFLKKNLYLMCPNLYKILKHVNYIKSKLNRKQKNELDLLEDMRFVEGFNEYKCKEYAEFRNYYLDIIKKFDVIIFNSNVTKEVFSQYINLDEVNYNVIPVTHTNIKDNRKTLKYEPIKNKKINFLFLSYLDDKRGFFDLIKVFDEIKNEYSNWQLNIYGDYSKIDIESFDSKFYKFHGKYNHNNLKDIFLNSSMIIIPSKWKETFGFIGLEAYSYGIPALVSENVGFSMVINENKNGIVYKESKDNIYLKNL